jgi:RNA polymerase sigma-70 factor (ECF subfamily)
VRYFDGSSVLAKEIAFAVITMSQPAPPFESKLLTRVQGRDPAAMELFFEHYFDRVYGYVLRLLQNRDAAEDVSQEAFLRMAKALDHLDPHREPSGWVFRIATNCVRDHWRSRHQRNAKNRVEFDELWNAAPASAAPSTLDVIVRDQGSALIHQAMAELSPSDREIILLRSFEEFSTQVVGECLEITAESVRQRHSRAVRRLGVHFRRIAGEDSASP